MKCEKCGNNEATFHYQSNINGEVTEYHYCTECAEKEGLGNVFSMRPRSMFNSFWGNSFGSLMSGFFDDPFMGFGRSLMAPVMTLPQVRIMVGDPEQSCGCGENSTECAEKAKDNIPEDAGEEIRSKRELFALKHQLKAAVRAEEFEKAAELRDKIRSIEGK
ncbi:MAG: hypothetical protein EOM14_08040 [Clostridia bacterium]|nr:hypothetical protein [Clostridia bacterium]